MPNERKMIPGEFMQLNCRGCNWEFEIKSFPVQHLTEDLDKYDKLPVREVKICPNCGCSSLTVL